MDGSRRYCPKFPRRAAFGGGTGETKGMDPADEVTESEYCTRRSGPRSAAAGRVGNVYTARRRIASGTTIGSAEIGFDAGSGVTTGSGKMCRLRPKASST
jgi:hypothetical protein